ncbi:unnamed protein product [Mucor fragilis]
MFFNPTKTVVFMLQVCQNQCDVKALALCNRGLCCLWKQASLTLPSCPKVFAENSHSWFATLELIRTSTIKFAQLLEQHDGKSYDSHFNRKGKGRATDYKDWLRGTFFPSDKAEDPVILPVPLYDPASNETETEPAKKQRTIF